ncbi:STAS domain-containing protein [Planococcus lenghuensis]|uniref:Anti-anti-sigma factor n=1 Tax=Planococcus lenghuensis TaxID=2213202 RepID=A0A1Q2KWR7_9BACL|nr:STAS domain-containing protein [Planococcus lenghuensis]AQQ52593.1 anti-anti-sigma factor [Planococcus lenghuensis]
MSSFSRFAEYVSAHAEQLAAEVVETVMRKMQFYISENEQQSTFNMYVQLLSFFGESLLKPERDEMPAAVIDWSKKNAAKQVAAGGAVSEIVIRYPLTRSTFNDLLTRISIDLGLSQQETAHVIKQIDGILDVSLNETIFAFEEYSDRLQRETQQELAKLSAPIVPVKDDIVILPLIGKIDMDRADYILDYIVPQLADRGVTHVISDYSGVYAIDEQIAAALGKIGNTLRLMGIRVIVAGLRPDLAQSIVNSGLDMKKMESYATVKQALKNLS